MAQELQGSGRSKRLSSGSQRRALHRSRWEAEGMEPLSWVTASRGSELYWLEIQMAQLQCLGKAHQGGDGMSLCPAGARGGTGTKFCDFKLLLSPLPQLPPITFRCVRFGKASWNGTVLAQSRARQKSLRRGSFAHGVLSLLPCPSAQ